MPYPIYIPSLGRADICSTARVLLDGGIENFVIVVEPQEQRVYEDRFGSAHVISLPFSGQGIAAARTWIKHHSEAAGHSWHWQMDDDIRTFLQRRIGMKTNSVPALEAIDYAETFTRAYENLGAIGISSAQFDSRVPWKLNQQVYSVFAVNNKVPFYWRPNCHEDTDFALQILVAGWCTIVIKLYRIAMSSTGTLPGGNTEISFGNGGRLKRIRGLQRYWPNFGIRVIVVRGSPRPTTHHIWRKFTTPLRPIQ